MQQQQQYPQGQQQPAAGGPYSRQYVETSYYQGPPQQHQYQQQQQVPQHQQYQQQISSPIRVNTTGASQPQRQQQQQLSPSQQSQPSPGDGTVPNFVEINGQRYYLYPAPSEPQSNEPVQTVRTTSTTTQQTVQRQAAPQPQAQQTRQQQQQYHYSTTAQSGVPQQQYSPQRVQQPQRPQQQPQRTQQQQYQQQNGTGESATVVYERRIQQRPGGKYNLMKSDQPYSTQPEPQQQYSPPQAQQPQRPQQQQPQQQPQRQQQFTKTTYITTSSGQAGQGPTSPPQQGAQQLSPEQWQQQTRQIQQQQSYAQQPQQQRQAGAPQTEGTGWQVQGGQSQQYSQPASTQHLQQQRVQTVPSQQQYQRTQGQYQQPGQEIQQSQQQQSYQQHQEAPEHAQAPAQPQQQQQTAPEQPAVNTSWKHVTQWNKVAPPEANYYQEGLSPGSGGGAWDGTIPSGPPPVFTNAQPETDELWVDRRDFSKHYAYLRERRRAESEQARRHHNATAGAADLGYLFGGMAFVEHTGNEDAEGNFLSEAEITELRSRKDLFKREEGPVRRPGDYYGLDYNASAEMDGERMQRSASLGAEEDPNYQGYQAQKPRKHWRYEAQLDIPINNFEVEVVECVDPVRLIGDTLSNMKPPYAERELTEEEKSSFALYYTAPEGFKPDHQFVPRPQRDPSTEPICFSTSARKDLIAAAGGQTTTLGSDQQQGYVPDAGMQQSTKPSPLSTTDSQWYTRGSQQVVKPVMEADEGGKHQVRMPDWVANKLPPPQQPPYWAMKRSNDAWNENFKGKGKQFTQPAPGQQQPTGYRNQAIQQQQWQQQWAGGQGQARGPQQTVQGAQWGHPGGVYQGGQPHPAHHHQQQVQSIHLIEESGDGQDADGEGYNIVVESVEIVDGEQVA